ncbi:D-Ala-D-Ala carboxypeptidase family metallohydrolase [Lelliottia sp. SL45]|uniref:D-Ala-D-Ala carboxypeptidase family metallohydrolase n=1 Tax=Lelliottia sp. SL45 TaxID=2994665 RepID=UPI00227637D9|nr:D-Ala-D-Ala carboxypeptidase family metallohydrolase [Lelliottia sp. SL45]MCY1700991.1 D-Ala-D-Ala carboxypeptidase family metallohydrolase [Lelliottia sp. SL45]
MLDSSGFFDYKEFSCHCGCGYNAVSQELITVLIDVRTYFCKPVIINSGCRCVVYNKVVGGRDNSQHISGCAADIVVNEIPSKIVADYLEKKYPKKYGIGRYEGFTHIDVREVAFRWRG